MTNFKQLADEFEKMYGDDFEGGFREKIKDFWLSHIREMINEIKGEVEKKEKSMSDDKLECLCDGKDFCKCDFSENDGYNKALSDTLAILSKYDK